MKLSDVNVAHLCDDDDEMNDLGNKCIKCEGFRKANKLWHRCTLWYLGTLVVQYVGFSCLICI